MRDFRVPVAIPSRREMFRDVMDGRVPRQRRTSSNPISEGNVPRRTDRGALHDCCVWGVAIPSRREMFRDSIPPKLWRTTMTIAISARRELFRDVMIRSKRVARSNRNPSSEGDVPRLEFTGNRLQSQLGGRCSETLARALAACRKGTLQSQLGGRCSETRRGRQAVRRASDCNPSSEGDVPRH